MDNKFPPQLLSDLKSGIEFCFDVGDLKILCADLGTRYERLDGDNVGDKARELILYCWRLGILPELVRSCREARPGYAWPLLNAEGE